MTLHTCGRCGSLVEVEARRCHTCQRLFPALFGFRRTLDRWFSRDVSWAKSIVLFLALVYLASVVATQRFVESPRSGGMSSLSPDVSILATAGAMIPWRIEAGEWWRLFLANLLHVNPIHLLFNLSSLATLGMTVERLFGPARLVLVFVFAGAVGFMASAFLGSAAISAGASSGIAALLGALLGYGLRRKGNVGAEVRDEAIRWLVLMAIFGLLAPRVDNFAHFGGALAGFVLALRFDLRRDQIGRESDAARLGALVALGVLVIATISAVHAGIN
jgi:rhomboid protease GluP